jgi:hypothetical protein
LFRGHSPYVLRSAFCVLLVALLQNSQSREDQATQHQLNAIADARADLVTRMSNASGDDEFRTDIAELRAAVGFEDKERSSNNTH